MKLKKEQSDSLKVSGSICVISTAALISNDVEQSDFKIAFQNIDRLRDEIRTIMRELFPNYE